MSGTGGTPPTPQGYYKIRKFELYIWWNRRESLLDPSPIPNEGPAYLNAGDISQRTGQPPRITRWSVMHTSRLRDVVDKHIRTLPQRQHPETITPQASHLLHNLIHDFGKNPKFAPYINVKPSKTEGGSADAIYVNEHLESKNPVAHKIFHEVAHVHPSENSLHVYLSNPDARSVVEKGWGMRFSVEWMAPPGWIMVFAPRDEKEVEVVRQVVKAAVCFATGKDLRD
jgi:hypothetical protein